MEGAIGNSCTSLSLEEIGVDSNPAAPRPSELLTDSYGSGG